MACRCAACKYHHRKCPPDCILAPHFPIGTTERFLTVHSVFGSANVARLLAEVPPPLRGDAITTLLFEAEALLNNGTKGPIAYIESLQMELRSLQTQIIAANLELNMLRSRATPPSVAPACSTPPPSPGDSSSVIEGSGGMELNGKPVGSP
ncbi:hypothetical protein AMTRI_Chr13g122730 [Amborella trichopoda]|uniref:LOB domain-containing protein n=1 Tax=Amborella trichopoda TaxID=13333 RepID=W1PVW1_AMBTC|nr:hypothetical protein AMTR_s00184p00043710 [Amborella trichopoda]